MKNMMSLFEKLLRSVPDQSCWILTNSRDTRRSVVRSVKMNKHQGPKLNFTFKK